MNGLLRIFARVWHLVEILLKALSHDKQLHPPNPYNLKHHSLTHFASDPGLLRVSLPRLYKLDPSLDPGYHTEYGIKQMFPVRFISQWRRKRLIEEIQEHLAVGDSRAAVVMSVKPILVAAYSDELDGVVILKFPCWLAKEHDLRVGDRLLTVNTYMQISMASDVHLGPRQLKRFRNGMALELL